MDQIDTALVVLAALPCAGAIVALALSVRRARARLAAATRQIAELLATAQQSDERATEREGRWRRIVETAPQLVWTASADGRANYFSPQSAAFTGLSPGQFLGWGWLDPMHPDDRDHARQAWNRAVTEQREYEAEHRFRRFDGEYRWFACRGTPVLDERGRIVEWVGVSVDVTERKLVEARVEKAKRHLDLIIRLSHTSLWEYALTDGDVAHGRLVPAEYIWAGGMEAAVDQLEWPATLAKMGLLPEYYEPVTRAIQQCVDGVTPDFEYEAAVRAQDGSTRWRLGRGSALRDESGKAVGFTGVAMDITELKRVAQDLRHANERLQLAMTSANQTIWEYDMPDGSLANARQTLINVWESLGYDVPADPSASLAPIIHPDDLGYLVSKISEYLGGQSKVFETEHRVQHKDGSYRWQLGRGVALRDVSGKSVRFVGTSVDITEIKRIEGELQRAREAAESANRAKDEFLANVSHEIRTPMNAILGMTEIALDSARTDHQRQLLATVKSAARNLLGIINDLLDFSKIEAGKLALDQADFSLRAELGDTVRALAARAHRKGLELICHVHAAVPDTLFGDAGRLRQVLLNLIGNALKFTAQGEVLVEVRVDAHVASDPALEEDVVALLFTVRDTGIGIARDKQLAIFRAFEQEDSSTTRKYGGTGLGLTISAQLAALMGGEISVDSAPGKGSTFAFTARFARSTRPDRTSPPPASDLLEGLRVLVVDDNETNRRILGQWLTNWRMRPTTVGDASSALEELTRAEERAAPYGLVLLDGRMPDVDGITLAGQILNRYGPASKRIILLSSDDSPILATRSRGAGILAYLLKPVQQSELLETIWVAMTAASDAAPDPMSSLTKDSAPGTRSTTLRMLVAEDNELNVTLLRELLSQRGHRAQFVGDGRSAIAQAANGTFDLLLLDLHLPEMDGFEVVEAIRAQERTTAKHLPIIALTARSSNRDRERCLAAGMDEFLSKPIEADALWAAVDRMAAAFPPAPTRDSRLLDDRAILRACGGRAAVLDKLCQVFRISLPDHLTRVRSALRERDLPRLRENAHLLYGTLSPFSTIAGAVALTIEDSALRTDIESCAELVEQLESMCTELLEDTRALTVDELSL